MNIEMMRRTLERIEEDYTHFDMGNWGRIVTPEWLKARRGCKLACGTVGCMAGHAIIEGLGITAFKRMEDMGNKVLIVETAKCLLDLNDDEMSDLFFVTGRDHYVNTINLKPGTKKYAKAVVADIKSYYAERGVTL